MYFLFYGTHKEIKVGLEEQKNGERRALGAIEKILVRCDLVPFVFLKSLHPLLYKSLRCLSYVQNERH